MPQVRIIQIAEDLLASIIAGEENATNKGTILKEGYEMSIMPFTASINTKEYINVAGVFYAVAAKGYPIGTDIVDIYVISNIPVPEVDFHADDTTPTVGDVIQLFDDSTNNPTSWEWYKKAPSDLDFVLFNSDDQNPSFSPDEAGNWSIKLIATNADGSAETEKIDYLVVAEAVMPPVANFVKNQPGPITIGDYLTFTDTSTNTPTSWEWRAYLDGDPVPSPFYTSGGTTSKFFPDATGNWTVSLRVSNAGGTDTEIKTTFFVVVL